MGSTVAGTVVGLVHAALTIGVGDVACFVGAGGKTTAMVLSARELAAAGRRVLDTSTTKILEPAPAPGEDLVLATDADAACSAVTDAFRAAATVFLARGRLGIGPVSLTGLGSDYPLTILPHKLEGIPPAWVGRLALECGADVVLVEADGAGHRMLKAPNLHEPVLPAEATLVVPVGDLEAVGKPLTDEYVHRSVLLADLACLPLGSPISTEVIAIALAHSQGGLKGVPAGARVVPLLTTHGAVPEAPASAETARLILLSPQIQRVVVAYLRSRPPATRVFAT